MQITTQADREDGEITSLFPQTEGERVFASEHPAICVCVLFAIISVAASPADWKWISDVDAAFHQCPLKIPLMYDRQHTHHCDRVRGPILWCCLLLHVLSLFSFFIVKQLLIYLSLLSLSIFIFLLLSAFKTHQPNKRTFADFKGNHITLFKVLYASVWLCVFLCDIASPRSW